MISYDKKTKIFSVECKTVGYYFDVFSGRLRTLYFGKRTNGISNVNTVFEIPAGCIIPLNLQNSKFGTLENIPQDYSFFGEGDARQTAFKAVSADGVSSFDINYLNYEILKQKPQFKGPGARGGDETLKLIFKDASGKVTVNLYLTPLVEEDVIVRRAEAVCGSTPISIRKIDSLQFDIVKPECDVITLYGRHASEVGLCRNSLGLGEYKISSNRGMTSHLYNPFIALTDNNTTEDYGEAYGFTLLYSGSFAACADKNSFGIVRVSMGINPETFEWKLNPGESFVTPEAAYTYSCEGLNGMSRNFHAFFNNRIIRTPSYRPIVANTWEAFYFKLNEDIFYDFAKAAEGTGIDTIVLDDGWFGKRDDDTTSLGDWFEDKNKFPSGLKALSDKLKKLGLKFGIWIEPEMISRKSELFKAHPDWAVQSPYYPAKESRNQLVIDLVKPEVLQYVKELMYNVIKNSGADYVKWDMNRPFVEMYSSGLPADRQGEFSHRYITAVYELAEYLTSSFPEVVFEGCAGGGGRFDGGMLYYFPQIWASDLTDAHGRVQIQFGYSLLYPQSCVSCHVGASSVERGQRIVPLKTRANVAGLGQLGYEFDIRKLNKEDKEFIAEYNKIYKSRHELVESGVVYRGCYPSGSYATMSIVSPNRKKAIVFIYRAHFCCHDPIVRVKVKGLAPEKTYEIPALGIKASGAALCNVGIDFREDFMDYNGEIYDVIQVD